MISRTLLIFKLILVAIFTILLSRCTEEYFPEIDDNAQFVVISGSITNNPGPYKVTIEKSSEINSTVRIPVTGATVEIHQQNGHTELMEEVKDGIYQTINETFRGQVGQSYFLRVVTKEDVIFESTMETIQAPLIIDTIYHQADEYLDSEGEKTKTLDVYTDFKKDNAGLVFLRFSYEETWKFNTPYEMYKLEDGDKYRTCWKQNFSSEIIIKNTEELVNSKLDRIKITSISENTSKLGISYAIKIIQHHITEREFKFWERIYETNVNLGTLFDPIPYKVEGNIFCTSDKNIDVVGYFSASGVTNNYHFINNRQLPPGYIPKSEFSACRHGSDPISDYPYPGADPYYSRNRSWFFLGETCNPDIETTCDSVFLFVNNRYCGDCTEFGTNIKPDFWPDDF